MPKRKDLKIFLKETKEMHPSWDLSLIRTYKNNSTSVDVICHEKDYAKREHGIFHITPSNISNGKGCPKCSGKGFTSDDRKLFCSVKWNGFYDYSKADFSKVKEKTTVICPKHGEFEIDYDHHFNAEIGCKYCSYPSRDLNSFKKEAIKKHKGFYTYDNFEYIDAHTNGLITCPIHGDFRQSPNAHLRGQGCPHCAEGKTKLENIVKSLLIENGIEFEQNIRFNWLKTPINGQSSLDFFIPKINLGIECQGKQHFGLGGWNKQYNFKKQYEIDKWKKEQCELNNVKLIYFANENEAPNEYFGKIFTDEKELLRLIRYLY